MLYMPMLPRWHAMPHSWHVNSAVHTLRSDDSYKTENIDHGKANSRDTRATNCEAGTRDQQTSSYLRFLVGVTMHPWVYVRQVLSPVTSHKPFFTLPYISTTHAHCILELDMTYTHIMYTSVHRPHWLSHSACRLQHSSGSPPAMIITCLVYIYSVNPFLITLHTKQRLRTVY